MDGLYGNNEIIKKGIVTYYRVAVFLCFKGGVYGLEVKINKEIRNYTESMFFGLSMRQFLFSVLACGVAVGLFFLLRGRFGTETLSWMCILGASPFAVMGFVRYNGMTAEQFVWAWVYNYKKLCSYTSDEAEKLCLHSSSDTCGDGMFILPNKNRMIISRLS